MNKIFVVLLALASCQFDMEKLMFSNFQKFITKYKKKYNSVNEFLARYEVFKINVNAVFSEQNESFQVGITKFSDMTHQEFARTYLNLN